MQATFRVKVKIYWNKQGEFEILDSSVDENETEADEDDQDDQQTHDENNNEAEAVVEQGMFTQFMSQT